MNTTDVQGTLREMWETRPARPRHDRQVAGVASAIARRYDIDPTLVRIGFVVATFAGIGAALYIAGWALLPEEPVNPAHPAPRRSPRAIIVIGLGIATAFSLGSLFSGHVGGGSLVATLAIGGLLFLLHRSRGARGLSAAPQTGLTMGTAAAAAPPAGGVSLVKNASGQAEPTDMLGQPAQTPPAWDPLGAAPFAWDLPEPSTPPPAPAPRRPPVTTVTLGLALLAGAVTTGILLLIGAFTLANLPVVFGVALAVLGLGLLVGAVLHAGRGLIPFALLLIVLTWGVLSAPIDRWRDGEVGELQAAPTATSQLLPRYERSAGEIDLDLSNLNLTVPLGSPDATIPVRTAVSIGAGDVQVRVPADADVSVRASAGVGRVSFADREDAGPGAEIRVVDDLGADGIRSGRPLVLDLEAGAGNVEVQRG